MVLLAGLPCRNVQVTENVDGKLAYSTCYKLAGLVSTNVKSKN